MREDIDALISDLKHQVAANALSGNKSAIAVNERTIKVLREVQEYLKNQNNNLEKAFEYGHNAGVKCGRPFHLLKCSCDPADYIKELLPKKKSCFCCCTKHGGRGFTQGCVKCEAEKRGEVIKDHEI